MFCCCFCYCFSGCTMNLLCCVYCLLSGISKVFPRCFQILLYLSVCPWALKGKSRVIKGKKDKKIKTEQQGEGGGSHSISWTDRWGGRLWHVMTQTASFLPLLSRRWPYKWCCRLLPYAIKHAAGWGFIPFHTCRTVCSFQSLLSPFGKRKADYSSSFFPPSLPALPAFYCLLQVLVRGEELKLS